MNYKKIAKTLSGILDPDIRQDSIEKALERAYLTGKSDEALERLKLLIKKDFTN